MKTIYGYMGVLANTTFHIHCTGGLKAPEVIPEKGVRVEVCQCFLTLLVNLNSTHHNLSHVLAHSAWRSCASFRQHLLHCQCA